MQIALLLSVLRNTQITGAWKGKSAGGCGNYPETTVFNPTYQLKIDNERADNQILIELRGPKFVWPIV